MNKYKKVNTNMDKFMSMELKIADSIHLLYMHGSDKGIYKEQVKFLNKISQSLKTDLYDISIVSQYIRLFLVDHIISKEVYHIHRYKTIELLDLFLSNLGNKFELTENQKKRYLYTE